MNNIIEQFQPIFNLIEAQTPIQVTINTYDGTTQCPFYYGVDKLFVNNYNNDEHSSLQLILESPMQLVHEDSYAAILKYDENFINQFNPNVLLPDYGPWTKLAIPIETPYPIMYVTSNQDTFTIQLTDYHIIITVVLSGMY